MDKKRIPKRPVNYRIDVVTLAKLKYLMHEKVFTSIPEYIKSLTDTYFKDYTMLKGISENEALEFAIQLYQASLKPQSEDAQIDNEIIIKHLKEDLARKNNLPENENFEVVDKEKEARKRKRQEIVDKKLDDTELWDMMLKGEI